MNSFIFSYPTKVYFGNGFTKTALQNEIPATAKKVMLCYGGGSIKNNGIYDLVLSTLLSLDKKVIEFSNVMPNPTYEKVKEGINLAKKEGVEFILAVGGGSTIDCCKIISAGAKTEEDIWDLETVKKTMPTDFIPLGAVLTVAGTGAEMNDIAVISNLEKGIKKGLIGATPCFSVLEPAFTLSAPIKQVISGAFDTLSHCFETFLGTPRENNLSDDINIAIIKSVVKNTKLLVLDPENQEIRSELMWASAMAENGILKIGKEPAFQAHQIEHQLAVYTDCNHGMGLAVISPAMYEKIYMGAPKQFAYLMRETFNIKTKNDIKACKLGIKKLKEFIKEIGMPLTLREMGITSTENFDKIAESVTIKKACSHQLTKEEIKDILYKSL